MNVPFSIVRHLIATRYPTGTGQPHDPKRIATLYSDPDSGEPVTNDDPSRIEDYVLNQLIQFVRDHLTDNIIPPELLVHRVEMELENLADTRDAAKSVASLMCNKYEKLERETEALKTEVARLTAENAELQATAHNMNSEILHLREILVTY